MALACTQIEWSADGSSVRTPHVAFAHKLLWAAGAEGTSLTLGVPDRYPEDEWQVKVTLAAHTSVAQDVVLAVGRLGCRDLFQSEGVTAEHWVSLREPDIHVEEDGSAYMGPVPEDGPVLARVCFRVATPFVKRPTWRQRLDMVEDLVPRLIRQGAALVPQPRIELRVNELSEVTSRAQDLTVDVYWGHRHVTRLREKKRAYPDTTSAPVGGSNKAVAASSNGQEVKKATVAFARSGRSTICLFFPAQHQWRMDAPDLRLVVRGTLQAPGDTYLGEARLQRHDLLLQPSARPAQLPLVEPLDPAEHGVYRKMPGLLNCSFQPVDIPPTVYPHLRLPYPRLCLHFLDVRHELQASHAAQLMQGLHCRLLWKGVEVARTLRVQNPSYPRWVDEVFSLPLRHESEHPTVHSTQPLFLQLFRRAVDRRGRARDELVGEVVPFNGQKRNLPSSYYPFDITSALGGRRDGRVIGQLGLGLWVDYADVDKDRTMEIIADSLEPGGDNAEYDDEEESKRPTAGDVHLLATMAVKHERKRRYSTISALAKSEQEALDMFTKAREVAAQNPGDRPLQQYVRLLQAEYERANRALKAAKIKGEEALTRAPTAAPVMDIFEGIMTKTSKAAEHSGDKAKAGAGGLARTTKDPSHQRRKPPIKMQGAKKDATMTMGKTTSSRKHGGHSPVPPASHAADAHAATTKQLSRTGKPPTGSSSAASPQASASPSSSKEGSSQARPDQPPPSPGSSVASSAEHSSAGVSFVLPGETQEPLSPVDRAKALLSDARLGPPVPVLEPSVYLVIKKAVGVAGGGIAAAGPAVYVLWCGKRVATTSAGKPSGTSKQQAFSWDGECFLLPLPPMIDRARLQLEVWSGQEFCGEVVVDGGELRHEYVSAAEAVASGRVQDVEHQLMPREYGAEAENKFGTLHFHLVHLQPSDYEPLGEEVVEYVARAMDDDAARRAAEETQQADGVDREIEVPGTRGKGQLSDAHVRFMGGSYLRCKYTVKLQVLSGHHLPRGWGGMDDTDPFVVLLLNGKEVGRSPPMDNSMHPVFRSGGSSFDLPIECAAEVDDTRHRLVLQLYDANTVTSHELLGTIELGPSDLRRLLGRAEQLLLKLVKPRKGSKPEDPVPCLTVATHVLARPPRESRIEMRIMGLQHALLPPPLARAAAVQAEVWWNDAVVTVLDGEVASSGRTSLSESIVDLPFACDDPYSQQRRWADTPTSLRVDIYHAVSPEQRRFLGQLSASGPFGLLVEEQDGHLLGSEYRTATYRLTPRPEMLINPTTSPTQGRKSAAAANPLDPVGGYVTCQFILCDPAPSAMAWLDSVRTQQERAPRMQLRILDAVNLADVAGVLKGKMQPSPSVAVYFNSRLVHHSAAQPATAFPVWEAEALELPLHGHSQSQFRDQVVLEVVHGEAGEATLLGCVSLSAKELYEPSRPGQRADYPLSMPPFGAGLRVKHRLAQGSLSMALEPRSSAPPPNATMRMRQTSAVSLGTMALPSEERQHPQLSSTMFETVVQSGGFLPRRWVRLNLGRARSLRKADLLGKCDPYCLVLWNRRTQLRTPVARKTVHPVWNQTFDLRFDEDELRLMGGELELRVVVMNQEVVGVDSFLGQVVLSGRQLLEGTGRVEALPLQPRADVAEDQAMADKLRASQLWLSVRAMEEVPFVQTLSAMQLRLPGTYLALDVVAVDAQGSGLDDEEDGATPPAFFVQLIDAKGNSIARTATASIHRGEARFLGEHYIFPVSEDGGGALSTTGLSRKTMQRTMMMQMTSRLERHDLSGGMRLEVFALFPNESALLGPSLKRLGHLSLSLQDFAEPPLYQSRQPLVQESPGLTSAVTSRRDTMATRYARAKVHLSLRLACVRPSPPRAFCRSLSTEGTVARLRLQVFGVLFDPLGEEGSEASAVEPPQWPRPQAEYQVELGFRQSTTPYSTQVPLLDRQGGSVPMSGGFSEYLLELPPDGRLREARLAMSVTQEAPAVVLEGKGGRPVEFEAKTEVLGEVRDRHHDPQ